MKASEARAIADRADATFVVDLSAKVKRDIWDKIRGILQNPQSVNSQVCVDCKNAMVSTSKDKNENKIVLNEVFTRVREEFKNLGFQVAVIGNTRLHIEWQNDKTTTTSCIPSDVLAKMHPENDMKEIKDEIEKLGTHLTSSLAQTIADIQQKKIFLLVHKELQRIETILDEKIRIAASRRQRSIVYELPHFECSKDVSVLLTNTMIARLCGRGYQVTPFTYDSKRIKIDF
jgi:hypothetical protein